MRTSIDVKFQPSFACFSTNSGYKRMFSLSDILQIAVAICEVVFLLFLLCFVGYYCSLAVLRKTCGIFRH